MASQARLDVAYLRMAKEWSYLSTARRAKHGALIVTDGRIISDGYNGTPSGFDNNCEIEEDGKLITKPEVLHAERNAIVKLARSTSSCEGGTIYITSSPCFECAKVIYQAGITRVVYPAYYRLINGLEFLKRMNVELVYVELPEIN
jgi:dCMP deaminase